MGKDYPNMNDESERKTWQEKNIDKYYYDRHRTTPEELLEINAREQRSRDNFHYDRHRTTPEELLEINTREQSGRDNFHYDRHYTTPEELLEINAREQRSRDDFHYDRHYYDAEENFMLNQKNDSDLLQFEEHHTSLEEYFGGPSDLTEKANEKREELMRKKMQREETERKFKESQDAKKEYERFQSLPMGQKLYEVVSFYGKSLARDPSTVEMSKRVFAALSDFRSLNFASMHELFDELKNSNDETLQEAVPYWEELLVQCEEAIKKVEASKYAEVKEEYTKSNMFSKFIARFKNPNAKVDESGKKR